MAEYARLGNAARGIVCQICKWPNISDGMSTQALLDQVGQAEWSSGFAGTREQFADSDDADIIRGEVRRLRDDALIELHHMIDAEPSMSLSWLLDHLNMVGREPSILMDKVALSLQVVYACLLTTHGPLNVFGMSTPVDSEFDKRISRCSTLLVGLSELLRNLDPEVCQSCELHDGVLTIEPSDWRLVADEVNLYGIAAYHMEDRTIGIDPFSLGPDVARIEQKWYGFSAEEMIGLLLDAFDGHNDLSTVTRVTKRDGLMLVDLRLSEPAHPVVSMLRQFAVLNPHFWRIRAAPSFFFADWREVNRDDQELIETASSVDWLHFAPLLCGGYFADGDVQVVGISTYGLLWRALQRARGATSNRLQLVERMATLKPKETSHEFALMIRRVHADFELGVAESLRAAGMTVLNSLERINDALLPCGEIDLLAQISSEDGLVVLVGECKNIDLIFYKDQGIELAGETIKHAGEQAQRKASWVTANWRKVATSFGWSTAKPQVVAVIVTRFAAWPTLPNGVPILPVYELVDFATKLAHPTENRWPILDSQGTWGRGS